MVQRAATALTLAAALAACSRQAHTPPPPPPSPFPSPSPLPDPLPEVAARVNGVAIPVRNAKIIVDQTFKDREPTPSQFAGEYRRALEQLVVRELLRQEAVARNIEPDPEAVARLAQQVRSEYKTDAEFKRFLAGRGLDPKSFREELRVRAAVEQLVKQETQKVPGTLPEEEARAYYAANPNLFESAGRPLPFEDVRQRIQQQVVTFKRQEALNAMLTRLRTAARIEKYI